MKTIKKITLYTVLFSFIHLREFHYVPQRVYGTCYVWYVWCVYLCMYVCVVCELCMYVCDMCICGVSGVCMCGVCPCGYQ